MSLHPLDRFLQQGDILHVAADGQMLHPATDRCPPALALLPGSFNPVHRGHWELARVAEGLLGHRVAFELSVANVDKPTLSRDEIRRRLAQFDGQAAVWLTQAPLFVQKAERFPGATFVVGADTAVRIASPRYYESDAAMIAALERIRALGCRVLVACRVDERGQCWSAADIAIPPSFESMFTPIAPDVFRWDVSSTSLRKGG
jgi:hypothetical protein